VVGRKDLYRTAAGLKPSTHGNGAWSPTRPRWWRWEIELPLSRDSRRPAARCT